MDLPLHVVEDSFAEEAYKCSPVTGFSCALSGAVSVLPRRISEKFS